MAEEFDFHPMWESLGMNLADHDMLLGAVGQMYGDMFLTQNNRPKSTSYLDFVATNIHSGRIKEMLDKKEAGEATKIVGSFCVYVPEEIVLACDGIPVGLCSGADWATDKVEEHLPRNTCPLIKSFAGFKLGEVCPYIESSDLVVGENTCDGKKKAYEFFATQKNMYVMDIPNVHDESTLVTWKAEVKKLAAKIEEECGVTITPERLKAAIHAVNEKRRALQRLAATRAADPAPISGLDSLLTVQAAFMDDTPRLTGAINDMAAECEQRVEPARAWRPRGPSASCTPVRPWPCPTGNYSTSSRRPAASWWARSPARARATTRTWSTSPVRLSTRCSMPSPSATLRSTAPSLRPTTSA